jgi:hypothetical protein
MTNQEAMKLALEALNDAWGYGTQRLDDKLTKAIKVLEEALANHIRDDTKMVSGVKDSLTTQQEQDEPVAWRDRTSGTLLHEEWLDADPLYTTPQQRTWVGLTIDEVDEAARYCVKSGQSVNAAIRAIEAKLKEKNNE